MIQKEIDNINSSVRRIQGKVELFNSSTQATVGRDTVSLINVSPIEQDVEVKLSSKNLLDFTTAKPYRTGTIEFLENGLTYNGNWYITFYVSGLEIGETYRFTCDYETTSPATGALWRYVYTDGTSSGTAYISQGRKAEKEVERIFFYPEMAATMHTSTLTNIQLEKGSTTTTYTPYIDNFEDVTVSAMGKNLITTKKEYVESIQSIYLNTTAYWRDFTTLPAGTYTLSVVCADGGIVDSMQVTNSSYANIKNNTKSNSLTFELIETTTIMLKCRATRFTSIDDVVSAQLELGTTATEYEPYIEPTTYTANIDGTVTNVRSIAPNMTIFTDTTGVLINTKCGFISLEDTYTYRDALKSFSVDRVGDETKFFGFGVCQKINVKLRDVERLINTTTSSSFKVHLGIDDDYLNPYPFFYVTETNRNENTNELSITAYDGIKKLEGFTVADLALGSYTIKEFAEAAAAKIGAKLDIINVNDESFNTSYPEGANFEGTETLRAALDDVAEATQTIYYLAGDTLVFKRLDKDGDAVLTLTKADYITLESKDNRRLSAITHATELGDNVTASSTAIGTTQYIRDNAFWELRDDIGDLVDNALAAVENLTINQFDCSWRGNYLLEIGDKIDLITKDDDTVSSYVLNDVVTYNGSLSEKTKWSYTENATATATNPTTIGEALAQTYARVDKANKQVNILVSENSANTEAISALQFNTDAITASVSKMEATTNDKLDKVNSDIDTLTNKVSAQLTTEDVKLTIQTELIEKGVQSVNTTTGFTFNSKGLTISKSDKEISTSITEDGMTVSKNNNTVLTANNEGVKAIDLHAETYLIIGKNSRFEDYNGSRTGCFWIGG